ncbi:DNA-binding protein [Paenibacillus sp. MMS20-IR301]|uniref:DNA-binding protein n=1 Tax=Paenibacillus sp. MMS20-IR301 TaxID=2895946 RepID=UPI0028EC821E|nr:DNA-binding protein [Paenibacillus sp. MMS20-IR301]WNS46653.1 DNA-binding protein [Paenibacillus sp. MMS20-IR301]
MKPFNISLLLSSVVLGASFVTGCYLLAHGQGDREPAAVSAAGSTANPLMTLQEAAEYMNLTEEQVKTIIEFENYTLDLAHSYTGRMFPYIKINNEFLVGRDELDEWIKENTQQRKEYTK